VGHLSAFVRVSIFLDSDAAVTIYIERNDSINERST